MRIREAATTASTAFLITASALTAITVLAPTAHAETITDLGMDDFATMVVDDARDQLIISGGTGETHLKLANFDGAVTGTIGGLDGPSGMVIVGSTLYVFEHSSGQITPVDLTTNAVGAAITSSLSGGYMLGYAGGYLWTSRGNGLDRINPSNGAVTTFTGARYPTGATVIDFATDPSAPSRLAVVADGTDTTLRIYDASASPPTKLAGKKLSAYATPQFTSDGASIVVATGVSMTQLSAADLSVEHTYPGIQPHGTTFVWGVDTVDRGGRYLAELTSFGTTVFADVNDAPVFSTYESPFIPATRGIRFSPSGDQIFAVSHYSTGTMQLYTFDNPTLFGSAITMAARERVPVFTTIHLSGQLTFNEGTSVGAGVPIEIWVSTGGGAPQLFTTVSTSAGGAWSADYPTDADDVGPAHDFSARFGGDAEHRGSTAETSVIVSSLKRELTLTASRHSITLGQHVRLTVNLKLDDHGGTHDVRIYREQAGDRRLIGIVTVDDTGVGSLVDTPTSDATYQAIALHDATHQRSVSNFESVSVLTALQGRLTRY
ncbi:MAG: hypothetical protein QOE83_2397 [Actinomycetota bacterium]|jgi:hypothetical protein|nr:hypothetical protein [Actinomycetota bacterium]